MSDVVKER